MSSKALLFKEKALRLFAAVLFSFLLAGISCKGKPRKDLSGVVKIKVEKRKVRRKKKVYPESFTYNPRGLRDPFEKPERGNYTLGKILAVLRGESGEFMVLMDIPEEGMRLVKKGDRLGDFRIVDLKDGHLVVMRRKTMPWGEVKVYREEIPLPGVGR